MTCDGCTLYFAFGLEAKSEGTWSVSFCGRASICFLNIAVLFLYAAMLKYFIAKDVFSLLVSFFTHWPRSIFQLAKTWQRSSSDERIGSSISSSVQPMRTTYFYEVFPLDAFNWWC